MKNRTTLTESKKLEVSPDIGENDERDVYEAVKRNFLHLPQFTVTETADIAGMEPNTLRQWLKRDVITRNGEPLVRPYLFSGLEAMTISVLNAVSKIGVSLDAAAGIQMAVSLVASRVLEGSREENPLAVFKSELHNQWLALDENQLINFIAEGRIKRPQAHAVTNAGHVVREVLARIQERSTDIGVRSDYSEVLSVANSEPE